LNFYNSFRISLERETARKVAQAIELGLEVMEKNALEGRGTCYPEKA